MSGSVLIPDAFAAPWGLTDSTHQVVVAHQTSEAAALSGFHYYVPQTPSNRGIFYVRSVPTWQDEIRPAVSRLEPSFRKLIEISQLPPGWNSYSAQPVDHSTVVEAMTFLIRNLPLVAPLPEIVPTVRGGIQLEWHTLSIEVEVHVSGRQAASLFALDLHSGEEFEAPFAGNESRFKAWISR